jgi:hypothetical protein
VLAQAGIDLHRWFGQVVQEMQLTALMRHLWPAPFEGSN